jgi:hypothetical protein
MKLILIRLLLIFVVCVIGAIAFTVVPVLWTWRKAKECWLEFLSLFQPRDRSPRWQIISSTVACVSEVDDGFITAVAEGRSVRLMVSIFPLVPLVGQTIEINTLMNIRDPSQLKKITKIKDDFMPATTEKL